MATGGSDKKFLLSCLDPFHPSSRGVALPSGSSTASYKASAVIRVDGQLDSNGNGVIMYNPSVANDCVSLWYNNSSQPISTVYPFSTAIIPTPTNQGGISPAAPPNYYFYYSGPGVVGTCAQALPFSSTDLIGGEDPSPQDIEPGNPVSDPPKVRGRVVSSGMKITFSGSTFNDGGVAYALVEPTHDSLQNMNLSTLQQYTATKVQRLALRNTIELVAFPCSRAQQEFSNAYDDMTVSYACGVHPLPVNNLNGASAWNVARYQVRMNGTNALNMNPSAGISMYGGYSRTAVWEQPNVEKALMSVLYPLSRRNAMKMARVYRWSNVYVIDSKVYWLGAPPEPWANGAQVTFSGNPGWYILTFDGADWYIADPGYNQPNYVSDIASEGTPTYMDIMCDVVTPPVFGAVYIKGGAQMANATFHVEYVVHCEYAGIGVQGRTTPNIPNEHVMDLALSAVDHARETSGQHESASFKHVALAAVEHVAARHAPALVQAAADVVGGALGGPVGAAFGEVAGGLVAQALKRHRR